MIAPALAVPAGACHAPADPPAPPMTVRPRAPRPSRPARSTPAAAPADAALPSIDRVDTRYLQTLLGYNARRAALTVIGEFLPRMAPFGLRPVDFSILSVINHNEGITSRQLCDALALLPPNLVGKIGALEKRGLLLRQPHPQDGRALGLHLTPAGRQLMAQAEVAALELERQVASALTPAEHRSLLRLLQKVYQP
jgi:DNA-binding MarR family transcriptional regulator